MDKIEAQKSGKIKISLSSINFTPLLIAILVVLITTLIYFIYKKRKAARTNFLLIGLCDSGKTLVFSQLLYKKERETFTSISENIGDYQHGRGSARIIDLPGHERLRSKYFEQYKHTAKGIVFVVDSVTLQKDVRDVADYLYTILSDKAVATVPILILCNKQDETMAKAAGAVKVILEKELNLIRTTRASQLQSVDNSEVKAVYLGKEGKDLEFSHLTQNIQIVEASALKNELNQLSDWIDRIV